MWRHVPNLLTLSRLVLAFVFFGMLSFYQYDGRGDPVLLTGAFLVYLVALVTDFLDGYLARKWKVEGAFGRVIDPFVDKVLVLGSFIFFAGKNFIIPDWDKIFAKAHWLLFPVRTYSFVVYTITGVTPAMVVILLGRELLVTTFRGMSESTGQNFGAAWSGKVKMVLQSITVLVILVYVNWLPKFKDHAIIMPAATIFRDICIWGTIAITLISGALYARRAVGMYFAGKGKMAEPRGFEVIPVDSGSAPPPAGPHTEKAA